MSAAEILKKFDDLEVAMKTHLSKVDPPLVVDLILRQRRVWLLHSMIAELMLWWHTGLTLNCSR
jgi:hypothetical protein